MRKAWNSKRAMEDTGIVTYCELEGKYRRTGKVERDIDNHLTNVWTVEKKRKKGVREKCAKH